MLYYKGLEDIIFSKHELIEEPDELIIISGYLGPSPIERLKELPMSVTIIGGMYTQGIDARLHHSLEEIKTKNSNLTMKYSTEEIHSKIYIWKQKGKTLSALIGSANFSSNGLRTDYRESLAEATRDTFSPLDDYLKFILNNSTDKPVINKKKTEIVLSPTTTELPSNTKSIEYKIDIPLYSVSNGTSVVMSKSGLNWGLSGAHVAEGDGYIHIPKYIYQEQKNIIKPFDKDFKSPTGTKKRNSEPIELVWDDGVIMEASFEGIQIVNGQKCPKQLASYSSKQLYLQGKRISKKSILGRYMRNRLGVEVNEKITFEHLEKYGRTTITLSLIEDGVYYADFSVK
ncbi:TPA_asm: NgoFVII family restriction endonuclease [Listeria monocytogenes]|uniref:restriction endonuclease PLD domain-containing protein n=1 Tax=Listeria monocytogenes TaxID=1639 RepID=UPI00086A92AF|nr:restriction endonuclease PLD domain-containing protein [Listeria monocytogenes]EAE7387731.1 NgoFVII family restriction endonuclease [Listeria monocytogenes]EAF2344327.1 NgoFVII family restriction endonuclease [Listeria monocytogenes]EAF6954196.1 NgoFVII family restriction endonuclease [Listeria monocytogenes]EAG6825405.1 NgoFVII family restriction endonuclease [Listeria monocytogenes]EGB4157261.1 NgoFVII family restriction endonuclease [Listeria monocytogenes]